MKCVAWVDKDLLVFSLTRTFHAYVHFSLERPSRQRDYPSLRFSSEAPLHRTVEIPLSYYKLKNHMGFAIFLENIFIRYGSRISVQ